jgi:4,5-dihydroxyphthalate decarboxylase
MSLSNYTYSRSIGDDGFVAIPVFPSRCFRHSCIYINARSGIAKPEDLKGKSIGVPSYCMTAAVWIRGLLQHDFALMPMDMKWYFSREDIIDWKPPDDLALMKIREGKTLDGMLVNGEIQALVTARNPASFKEGSPEVERLFPDFKKEEEEYYIRTGLFPIMHVIVIRRPFYEKRPWIAESLYKAFLEAKDLCYLNLNETGALKYTLAWLWAEYEKELDILGEDFWSYGLLRNRKTLETLISYSYEQGLTQRMVPLKEMFVKETLDT